MTTESPELAAQVVPLVDGKLYLLTNPYAIDGRICTHPLEVRGYASQNCFLFVEEKKAVLIDTGFSIHETTMIGRLAGLVGEDMTLEVGVLRLGEYYGTCNVRPIVDQFDVQTIYSTREDGLASCDFRPEYVPYGTDLGTGRLGRANGVKLRGSGQIELGGERVLQLLRPPLRLLATNWLYDTQTRTLLTADHFAYLWMDRPEGPWVSSSAGEVPSDDHIRDFLIGTRYWWLPGSRTNKMIADLLEIFDTYPVDRIGPGYGRVLEGPDVVREHVDAMRRVLEHFPDEPATGVDAGYTAGSVRAPMAAGA